MNGTSPPVDPEHGKDKKALFLLASLVVVVLGSLRKMFPCLPTHDALNGARVNAVPPAQRGQGRPLRKAEPDGQNIGRRKFRAGMFVALRLAAVSLLVADILFGAGPSEVLWEIVFLVAVIMGGVSARRWWRPVKGGRDAAMHHEALSFSVHKECQLPIAVPVMVGREHHARTVEAVRNNPLYPPQGRGGVVRRERDGFPDFGAIVGVSHCALLSREGQGRTLFPQRFRPAFYSALPLQRKAA